MVINWINFTPVRSLAGGALIGLSAALFMLLNGRIAGISGLLGGLLTADGWREGWRVCFVAGLLVAATLYVLVAPLPPIVVRSSTSTLIIGGLLVGFGTRAASGCTSGHGVCGLSRGSIRSFVATSTFMLAGFATVWMVRHG
ncbi:YeeE/YedE family protein [Caballeronia sp. DA-9]|uniref:YeeE/YedE family protein n=1 Tax=Caballeronia sp. DA-9 TaxID=3436237 RepID=UPI003F674AB4